MLLVSFCLGVAAAADWTWATTLVLVCAFCGFQAKHPLVVQINNDTVSSPGYWSGQGCMEALQ